jgi:hypothetical protein
MPFYVSTEPTPTASPRVVWSLDDPAVDGDAMDQDDIRRYVETHDNTLVPVHPGKRPAEFAIAILDKARRNDISDQCGTLAQLHTAYFRACVVSVSGLIRIEDDGRETSVTMTAREFETYAARSVVQEIGGHAWHLNNKQSPLFYGPQSHTPSRDTDSSETGG